MTMTAFRIISFRPEARMLYGASQVSIIYACLSEAGVTEVLPVKVARIEATVVLVLQSLRLRQLKTHRLGKVHQDEA